MDELIDEYYADKNSLKHLFPEPFKVICVDSSEKFLTTGKVYEVVKEWTGYGGRSFYRLKNDKDVFCDFFQKRFRKVDDYSVELL